MNRVLKVNVPEYGEGAFILYSASKRKDDYDEFRVTNNFSFAYIVGDYAAEWEPEYGPIQVWHRCDETSENANKHYIFEYTDSSGWNWSQLAVDRHMLPQHANHGDWQYIFNVLKDWCEDR